MPRLELSSWLLWLAAQACQWGLVVYCLRAHIWRLRPAIVSFLALHTLTSSVLLAVTLCDSGVGDLIPAIYYWTFWASAGVGILLRIWIIAELAARACAGHRTQMAARLTVVTIAVLLCGVSAVVSSHTPLEYGDWWMRAVVTFGRAVSLTWITCFVIVGLIGEFFGIGRTRRETLLAAGLSLQAAGELGVSWLLGLTPDITSVSDIQDALYVLSLGLWARALCSSRMISPEIPNIRQLKEIAVPFFALGQRLKNQ